MAPLWPLRPLLLLALSLLAERGHGLDNGLARTPPMGWMTWERFRCTAGTSGTGPSCADDPTNCISETLVKQHADILAQPEWRSLGYRYVNIDDCWENWHRTPEGKLHANSSRFPHGMAALADYVHGKGLRLGTYNDMGTGTCGKYPGECKDELCTLPGYMTVDAETYAGWGIDSLKMVRSTPHKHVPRHPPPPSLSAHRCVRRMAATPTTPTASWTRATSSWARRSTEPAGPSCTAAPGRTTCARRGT